MTKSKRDKEEVGKKDLAWERLVKGEAVADESFPKISVILPTFNQSHLVSISLETILQQVYPDLEVIIIDAGSTDKTLDVIKSFYDPRIRITSVTTYHCYDMLNKGISLAKGLYISFLLPGDFYLYPLAFQYVMELAKEFDYPHLLYGATLLRGGPEVKTLYRPMTKEILRAGKQSTSVQACWFHIDTFRFIGKFTSEYKIRGGYDLFCRFCLHTHLRVVSTQRVLTDYVVRPISKKYMLRHLKETVSVIYRYFGWKDALKWFLTQKDLFRLIKMWFGSVKGAFLGQKGQ
ncbi:MAG: hypothetical protein Tsb0021_11830 [Chlamydiales bacterium]